MFQLGKKTCSPCLFSLVKTETNVWENWIADQWKGETQSRVFTCSIIFRNFPRFPPVYEGTDNMYFFYKFVIFRFNKEKDYIRSAYVCLNFFHETILTFHNLETEPTILRTSFPCSIAPWKHTCRPIKTRVLSKSFYNPHLLPV